MTLELKTTPEQRASIRKRLDALRELEQRRPNDDGIGCYTEDVPDLLDDADTATTLSEQVTQLQADRAALIEALSYQMDTDGWKTEVNNQQISYVVKDHTNALEWRVQGKDYPTVKEAIEAALQGES